MKTMLRGELEEGIRLQKEGRLAEAEAVYGRVAAVQPNNSDAWHRLLPCRSADRLAARAWAYDVFPPALSWRVCSALPLTSRRSETAT